MPTVRDAFVKLIYIPSPFTPYPLPAARPLCAATMIQRARLPCPAQLLCIETLSAYLP